MFSSLPIDLETRCTAISSPEAQGQPLSTRDYLLFVVATVLVPVLLIVIGSVL